MLTTSQRMAHKLAEAISNPQIKQTTIAEACGVSKQAVQGWLKTGRIDKRHLATLATITNYPLAWWLDATDAVQVSSNATPDSTEASSRLNDWRMQASTRSQEVIDQLTLLAKKNLLKDEDWMLIEQMARRFLPK